MFSYLVYRFQLIRLFSHRRKNIKYYEKLQKKTNDKDKIQQLIEEKWNENNIVDYEIGILTTTYYLQLARYKFIEIPKYDNSELWVESSLDPNRKVLSNKAISILRNTIRNERKARIDLIVKIITALTGLIGVLIGLLAIIIKG